MRGHLKIGGGLLAAALLLSGCTGAIAGDAPDPNSQATTAAPAPIEFASVDAALVGGLDESALANADAGVRGAEFPTTTATRNLAMAIDIATSKGLRRHASLGGTDYEQTWTTIGSSPEAVGFLFQTTTTVDDEEQTMPMAVWYDPASQRGVASPGLIGLDSWSGFAAEVLRAVPSGTDSDAIIAALSSQPAPYGDGPAIGFDADGNALVSFGSGYLAEPVVVPQERIRPLLSPFGRHALSSATDPSEFDPDADIESWDRDEAVGGEDNEAAAGGADEPVVVEIPDGPGGSGGGAAEPSEEPLELTRPYPWIGVNCEVIECIAMTYDDGPGPETEAVARAYVEAGQAISFFQLGKIIEENRETSALTAALGMPVENHTKTHRQLTAAQREDVEWELSEGADLITEITGQRPLFMRPPYGSVDDQVREVAKEKNQAIVNWDVDTNDWQHHDGQQTVNSATTADAGAVVLMHDIHEGTASVAADIPAALADREMQSVTVAELSDYGWDVGKVYPAGGYLADD